MNSPRINMEKVEAAVRMLEGRSYTQVSKPRVPVKKAATDSAIRKTFGGSKGYTCSGFTHKHFHNQD